MKSGILSFNKGLFLQHSRSVLWISAFFLLSQIVLLPLKMFVMLRDPFSLQAILEQNPGNILFTVSFDIQYLSYLVFPVLAGIVLTNYMTKKGSADFMHSLPFKRETLLLHIYLAGAAALAAPLLLTAVLLLIIGPFVQPLGYTVGNIAEWLAISCFIVLCLFFVTVLTGLFIGPAILQGVMAYGIFMLPAGLVILTLANARYLIKGFAADSYLNTLIEKGIFLFRAGSYPRQPFSVTEWAIYLGIAAAVAIVSFYVYKIRPAEAADETIVFPFFRWAFIFVFTFAAMLVGGMYFAEILGGSAGWMIAGFVIGAAAGYALLQMIVRKSLRLIWPWKGFAFYTAVIAVLLIPGTIFAKSYETALPAEEEIKKVYVGDSPEPFAHVFYMEEHELKNEEAGFMTGSQSIKQVRDVHAALKNMEKNTEEYGQEVTIIYVLKDGTRMQRQYSVAAAEVKKATADLRKNPEFIRASHPLFALGKQAKINYLTVYDHSMGNQLSNVAEKNAVEAIQTAVKKDALTSESNLFGAYDYTTVGMVDFFVGETGMSLASTVRLSDEHTIKAIREFVPNGKAFAAASHVEKAFIVKINSEDEKQQLHEFIGTAEKQELDWSSQAFEYTQVTNREKIETLLDPAGLTENSSQLLVIKWKSNMEFMNYTVTGLRENGE